MYKDQIQEIVKNITTDIYNLTNKVGGVKLISDEDVKEEDFGSTFFTLIHPFTGNNIDIIILSVCKDEMTVVYEDGEVKDLPLSDLPYVEQLEILYSLLKVAGK